MGLSIKTKIVGSMMGAAVVVVAVQVPLVLSLQDEVGTRELTVAAVAGLTVLVAAGGCAWFIARHIATRIVQTAQATEGLARGRLDIEPLTAGSGDEIGVLMQSVNALHVTLRTLDRHLATVERGDLTVEIDGDEALIRAMRDMTDSQLQVVSAVVGAVQQLQISSHEIVDRTTAQDSGTQRQAAMIGETERTMQALIEGSAAIDRATERVSQGALHTHENTRVIQERLAHLNSQTKRISDVLTIVDEVSRKSEILALNAALEGTRAGDAGRGFTLVANELQKLSERVSGAVEEITTITENIQHSTALTVDATEQAARQAEHTRVAVGQIAEVLHQQRSATRQVNQAMTEIAAVTHDGARASSEVAQEAVELAAVAARLQQLVARFRIA